MTDEDNDKPSHTLIWWVVSHRYFRAERQCKCPGACFLFLFFFFLAVLEYCHYIHYTLSVGLMGRFITNAILLLGNFSIWYMCTNELDLGKKNAQGLGKAEKSCANKLVVNKMQHSPFNMSIYVSNLDVQSSVYFGRKIQ